MPRAGGAAAILRATGVVALHAALVVGLTWPLAAHLGTHLPNSMPTNRLDHLLDAWNLAWQTHALVSAPTTLLDGNIFHPVRLTLLYGDIDYSALPLFGPPFLLTGNPVLALNVVFLVGVALTAAALHLVVHRWTGSHAGGFVAGVTFLTAPWVLWTWIAANPIYAVLVYLPVVVALAATPSVRPGRALALLAVTVLQALASMYLAIATLAPLGLLALARLLRPATRRAGLVLLIIVLGAGAVVAVACAAYLLVGADNPGLRAQTVYLGFRAARMALPSDVFADRRPLGIVSAAWIVVAAGALLALLRRCPSGGFRTGWLHAGFWLGAGLFIGLTRLARIGRWDFALPPQRLADALGVYGLVRDPQRLAVAGLVGASLLVGVAHAQCVAAVPTRAGRGATALHAALLAVVLAGIAHGYLRPISRYGTYGPPVTPALGAYPISPPPWTPGVAMAALLSAPGGPLLEVPTDRGAETHAEAMYRSIFHRRALLNGYNGYWPARFAGRMALACALPAPGALAALRAETGVEMILVDLQVFARDPHRGRRFSPYMCQRYPTTVSPQQAWIAATQGRRDLRLVAREGDRLLFTVHHD